MTRKVTTCLLVKEKQTFPTSDWFLGLEKIPLMYSVYDDTQTLPMEGNVVHSQSYCYDSATGTSETGTNAIKTITYQQVYNRYSNILFSFTRTALGKADILCGGLHFGKDNNHLYHCGENGDHTEMTFDFALNTKYWIYTDVETSKTYTIVDDKYTKHKLPALENWTELTWSGSSISYLTAFKGLSFSRPWFIDETGWNSPNNIRMDLNDIVCKYHQDSILELNGAPTWLLASTPSYTTLSHPVFNGEIIGSNVQISLPNMLSKGYIDTSACESGEGIVFSTSAPVNLATLNTCDIMFHIKLTNQLEGDTTSYINCYDKSVSTITKINDTGFSLLNSSHIPTIRFNSYSSDIMSGTLEFNGGYGADLYDSNGQIDLLDKEVWLRRTIVRDTDDNPHVVCWYKDTANGDWIRSYTTPASYWSSAWQKTTDGREGGSLQDFIMGNFPTDWGLQSTNIILYGDSYISVDDNVVWTPFKDGYTVTFNITPEDATITYSINGGDQKVLKGKILPVNMGDTVAYTLTREGYISYSSSVLVTGNETVDYDMLIE